MTYYHHSFDEYDNSKNIHAHFFNEDTFSHLFDSLNNQIELNCIESCLANSNCVWPIKLQFP